MSVNGIASLFVGFPSAKKENGIQWTGGNKKSSHLLGIEPLVSTELSLGSKNLFNAEFCAIIVDSSNHVRSSGNPIFSTSIYRVTSEKRNV